MAYLSSTVSATPDSPVMFELHTVAAFQGRVRNQHSNTLMSLTARPVDCFDTVKRLGWSRGEPPMLAGVGWKQKKVCSYSSSIQLSKLRQEAIPPSRIASTALGHSYRCPTESEKDLVSKIDSSEKSVPLKLPPGMFAEAVTKGLAYSVVHPLVLIRTRSIAGGLQRPSPQHLLPFTALGSCATQSAVEYALAMFLSRRVDAIFDKYLLCGNSSNENERLEDRAPMSLLVLKNLVAATITAGPSLAWNRVNQQLMLGYGLTAAVENVLGGPASILHRHPAMAREFLRGLPVAVLCLTVYLMIQDMTQTKSVSADEVGGESDSIPGNALRSGKFWAVANMAFIGFLDGVVDAVVGTAQLHGLSTVKAATKTFSRPLIPLAHGVLGAVSLGMLEFALKSLAAILVKK